MGAKRPAEIMPSNVPDESVGLARCFSTHALASCSDYNTVNICNFLFL